MFQASGKMQVSVSLDYLLTAWSQVRVLPRELLRQSCNHLGGLDIGRGLSFFPTRIVQCPRGPACLYDLQSESTGTTSRGSRNWRSRSGGDTPSARDDRCGKVEKDQ